MVKMGEMWMELGWGRDRDRNKDGDGERWKLFIIYLFL
jgi:hypothetical protein